MIGYYVLKGLLCFLTESDDRADVSQTTGPHQVPD